MDKKNIKVSKNRKDSADKEDNNSGSGAFNQGVDQDSDFNEGTKVSDEEKRTGHSQSPGKDGSREKGGGRSEAGDRRREKGGGRSEAGDRSPSAAIGLPKARREIGVGNDD